SRAVLEPGQAEESNAADGAAGHAEDGRMIIFPGRLGPGLSDFDRPRYMPPEGYSLITVDDLHDEKELEKLSMDIEGSENELRALELQGTDFVADILAQLGRLAWLYGKAREVSAFLGKQELSDEAERRRMATIKEAERIIDAIDWKGKGQLVLDDLVMLMAPWEPMFLGPKGEEVVFRIAEEVLFTSDVLEREVWAALVLAPSTRARAAAMLAEKDKVLQQWIIYMLRKQGINDLEGEEEFCRAYRADSHVNGWYERRLRNGGIEGFVGQLSEFVQQETARHGLDKEWRFALAKEYVTKFTVRLLRMRGTARNPRQPPPIVVP
ncbi:MAG TPA: hypothetical protein VJH24_00530, partial [Candidatus Bilamarchaeaceae archaeon]|nr:hypothetical protein [Candidatus Bilamarchaeaceae archaeon]